MHLQLPCPINTPDLLLCYPSSHLAHPLNLVLISPHLLSQTYQQDTSPLTSHVLDTCIFLPYLPPNSILTPYCSPPGPSTALGRDLFTIRAGYFQTSFRSAYFISFIVSILYWARLLSVANSDSTGLSTKQPVFPSYTFFPLPSQSPIWSEVGQVCSKVVEAAEVVWWEETLWWVLGLQQGWPQWRVMGCSSVAWAALIWVRSMRSDMAAGINKRMTILQIEELTIILITPVIN